MGVTPLVRPSVRPSITKLVNTSEPMLTQIGTRGSQGRGIKRSTLGSGGRRSRSREAEDRFGDLAEASLLAALGRTAFLVG